MLSGLSRRSLLAAGAAGLVVPGSLVSAAASSISTGKQARKRVLRFAHLTDVHLQPERSGGEGFAAALNHVQSLQDAPDFIMFGGDNVMNVDGREGAQRADVQLDLWKSVLREHCSLPWKTVIGNHDILRLDNDSGKAWAMDAYGLSSRYATFDRSGWRFILLDSTSPQKGGGYKGRLDEEQFDWMKRTIESTPETTPICVVSHIPILAACAYFDGDNEKSGDWCVPGAWMHLDARAIKDVFHQHDNVKLCISGHIHLVDTVDYLGVRYACNGAVSGGWWGGPNQEFEPGYALVDLFDDGSTEVEFMTYGWKSRP